MFIFKKIRNKKKRKKKGGKGKEKKKLIPACISLLRYIPELVH
jgi:hypothetical protein